MQATLTAPKQNRAPSRDGACTADWWCVGAILIVFRYFLSVFKGVLVLWLQALWLDWSFRLYIFLSSNYFLTFFALVTPPEDCKTGNLKLTQNFHARKTSKIDKKGS